MNDLQLPKTKLTLSEGVLRKLGEDDVVIATFALADIKDIRCEKTADYGFPLVLMIVFAALAVVAKLYIPSSGLAWTVAIICGAVPLFGVLGVSGRKIVVQTQDGTVGYPVTDRFEDAEGFVISVKQRLKASS